MPNLVATDTLPRRSLWLTLVAVVVAFFAATMYSQYSAFRIDVLASSIARNSTQSIRELSAARAELRYLELLVSDYAMLQGRAGHGNGYWRPMIDEVRERYAQHIGAYLRLPLFPGERDRWGDVERGLSRLDDTVVRIVTLVDEGRLEHAQGMVKAELHRDVEQAANGLWRSVDFNAGESRRMAYEIEKIRSRMMTIAFGLDVACAYLALALGIFLHRIVKRHGALVKARAHGGEVGVVSKPGEGCLFWFELPLIAQRSSSPERALLTH